MEPREANSREGCAKETNTVPHPTSTRWRRCRQTGKAGDPPAAHTDARCTCFTPLYSRVVPLVTCPRQRSMTSSLDSALYITAESTETLFPLIAMTTAKEGRVGVLMISLVGDLPSLGLSSNSVVIIRLALACLPAHPDDLATCARRGDNTPPVGQISQRPP